MKFLVTGWLLFGALAAGAQSTLQARVRNEQGEALPGATLQWGTQNVVADSSGALRLTNIPNGPQHFTVSFVGYEPQQLRLLFPVDSLVDIRLHPAEPEEEETVVVTASRLSRSIAQTPTRTEVISGEELAEKGNMKPGDIRMLLNESTGIQTQQTSATSYNAGIRIQGLDGRYTQLLRDGYPLYAGFAGGLSLLQIAPLDLKQVEVIKGSASTLYGGGAIAGLVNLVSKTPGPKRELSFLANATSAAGLDLSGFYSERFRHTGVTVYAARNSTAPYDPAGTGFTAIPQSERYTVNPRLFVYGKHTTLDFGLSLITEDRRGGNLHTVRDGGGGYLEQNQSGRVTAQLGITRRLGERASLQFKNSYSYFQRVLTVPGYRFNARQYASFSELTWSRRGTRAQWVAGANLLTDRLNELPQGPYRLRSYLLTTTGVFLQNGFSAGKRLYFESGLRADWVNRGCGLVLLPRVSALYRISTSLSLRAGGGLGYKTPTPFTEESERILFRNLQPINPDSTRNERSLGVNADGNYRTRIGALGISVNLLLFYTRLNHPLLLLEAGNTRYFRNGTGHLDTRGLELNARLTWSDWKLFLGYTLTDAATHFDGHLRTLPLTARHRLNNVLVWEKEGRWKLGLEAYYYSPQLLGDGTEGRSYWLTGFMAEHSWKTVSLFVNFENITDTRQTRFGPLYTGTPDEPQFRDIYAPLDGFLVNGGIKLRF